MKTFNFLFYDSAELALGRYVEAPNRLFGVRISRHNRVNCLLSLFHNRAFLARRISLLFYIISRTNFFEFHFKRRQSSAQRTRWSCETQFKH